MKQRFHKAIFLSVFLLSRFSYSQNEIGIDVGQPINPSTGAINLGADTAVVGQTCTPWVRVNFILGPWLSPGDQTLHNGHTWQQAYDEIINAYVAKGIQVYGLIGAEAYTYPADTLEQYPGPDSASSVSWIQNYTANFVQIVDMFKDRVRVFESFNEPNNWTNSPTAIVHEAWFALMLQEIYLNTKYYNGHNIDPAWQVTLVSGALFTFDLNTGGQYISDTYWYGKNVFAWDWTHANVGTYPLDGLGQHIYVAQGDSSAAIVGAAITNNLDGFWNGAFVYEDDPNKRVWISEFGWETGVYGESFQAQNLSTGFNVLQADSRVRLSLWFTQSDFPGGDWGLYYMGTFLPTEQKQSFAAFKSRNNCSLTTGVRGAPTGNLVLFQENGAYFLDNGWPNNTELSLYGLEGRVLNSAKAVRGRNKIDTGGLSPGIYYLRVLGARGQKTFKLLVY